MRLMPSCPVLILAVIFSIIISTQGKLQQPNFLIVLADDVGATDIGLFCREALNNGSCPQTPVLDAMASSDQSVVFRRFYAGAGVCSPTRASLLTGRNNKRVCISSALPCDHMNPAWSCSQGKGLSRNAPTIAHAAKQRGYMTQHIGKWHLGDFWNKKDPSSLDGFSNPSHAGFDEWSSTQAQTSISAPNCGCFPPVDWTPPNPAPQFPRNGQPPPEFPHNFPGRNCIVGGGMRVNESFDCANYWQPSSLTNHTGHCTNLTENIRGDDGDYLLGRFDDFVARSIDAEKPFLSTIWFHYIHLPHPAMPEFFTAAQKTGDPDYTGALAQWDDTIGRIKLALSKRGVLNDTLIWVTSDNGPHCSESPGFCSGPLGRGRSNGGLRGCKASIWEGGIRVPGFIEWPSGIKSRVMTDVPAVTHDILPTIMELLHIEPDAKSESDGVSLVPFFNGQDLAPTRREKPIGFFWGGEQAWIDNDLKLIGGKGDVSVGQGCYALPPWDKKTPKRPLLFNISADATESFDLKAEMSKELEELGNALQSWVDRVSNSATTEFGCDKKGPSPPTPPSPPSENCIFQNNTIGYGSDSFKAEVTSKEACCGLCRSHPQCKVAVLRGAICHGKHGYEPSLARKGDGWSCLIKV